MKPKLKADVFWVPKPDGVTFVHSNGHLNITGKTAYQLVDRLAPFLDGSTELDALVADLPTPKQDMVTTVVTALARAGLVKDTSTDQRHTLDETLLRTYAAEIAYIDYYLDSAAHRFQRYRETPVVCIGSGMTFTALVHACLRSGLRQVTAIVTDESPTDLERIEEYVAEANSTDPAQRFVQHRPAGRSETLPDAARLGEMVLHVSDRYPPDRARELDRLCRRADLPLIQGVVVGEEAWTGPVGGAVGPGWEAVWQRRQADPEADPAPSSFLAGPTAGIVANRVAFLAFRHLTGVADTDQAEVDPTGANRPSITRIDLETLQTTTHRCHPHPAATEASPETEAEFVHRYAAFRKGHALGSDDFSALAATLFDPYLGLFTDLDEHDLPQLPLRVAKAVVADPFGILAGAPEVHGAGDDLATARRDCGEVALRAYAALAVDTRRLHRADGAPRAYAHNLALDKPEPLDARQTFPTLARTSTSAEAFTIPVGLVSGATADEALTRGLLEHCVARTAAQVAEAAEPYPLVDPVAECGEQAVRLMQILRIAGVDTAVYDVTGPLGVRVYAVCADGGTVAYVSGDALPTGLKRAILADQGIVESVPPLPKSLRGISPAREPEPYQAFSWQDLAGRLHALGYQVHALPAGHDPVVASVLPTLVQVVVHG